MPLTRLDNLYSSKTGKYLYVSPDDFNATDALDNRGNSPLRPFVTIQRAFLEVARYSYVPNVDNDRFDQFTIMLSPGNHYIDNRPGDLDTGNIPIFEYDAVTDEWNDDSIFDLSNPNNILYRFNGRDGGATIPRGTSLVGTDLRRTQVRALYVPDPADKDVPRTALFNVTGGCYFWQFTILDANDVGGPLVGKAYNQPGSTQVVTPLYSHHKMTNFVFADKEDLGLLYRKIAQAFSKYQPDIDDVYTVESGRIENTWYSTTTYNLDEEVVFGGEAYKALQPSANKRPDLEDAYWKKLSTISREFDYKIQENRIVGPLSDTVQIDSFVVQEPIPGSVNVTVRTKINHGFFPGQYVAVSNLGYSKTLEGVFQVLSISPTNPKEFTYRVNVTVNALGLSELNNYFADPNATVQAEVDSVESASPYVFNVSIRSTWGICGIWADGRKATGFKSMVIAQYTGVSLQKDDRAFIRYDEFSNTWNEASLTDAFATTPYHIKGDAYWKDDWRNFHVRASDDSFIQNVSIFAVGFADHFLLESGGDMSITNSNSNFGNTSMHSKGYKGFAFNQDKGGYITDIIPPQTINDSTPIKITYYSINVPLSKPSSNSNRLYLVGDKASDYLSRPAASINGYRIGARTYINDEKCEKLYVSVTADTTAGESGANIKYATISPQGFKIWSSSLDTLSPSDLGVGDLTNDGIENVEDILFFNLRQDAANLIDANKTFIQAEAFGYILEKYPYLQNISYVNPNITAETGRYRDAANLIRANREEILNYAFTQTTISFPSFVNPDPNKCKRDIGYIIDALANDLYDGGNTHIIEATKAYFDGSGQLTTDGLLGEQTESVFAFNRLKDWAKKAISNLLGNKSLLSVASVVYNSGSNTVTVTTFNNHGLIAGQSITVGGATDPAYNGQFEINSTGLTATEFTYTPTSAPILLVATGAFYISTIVIDPVNDDPGVGRYKDASNLVSLNREEIIDRAIAAVSINYPDFVYPTDPGSDESYRYKDAYRLIQINKQEIITNSYNALVASGLPVPEPTDLENKCKRDIGLFIDAVSLDIAISEGNVYSRKFAQQYFSDPSTLLANGLLGEQAKSVLAFNAARDQMKLAVTNQLTNKDLTVSAGPATYGGGGGNIANTDVNSCADVRNAIDTLTLVINEVITAGNLSVLDPEVQPTITLAGYNKCRRDLGYIIDSIAQDLFWGGNEFTVGAITEYYQNSSLLANGIAGEIPQSVIAFDAAREQVKKAITNQLYGKNLSISYGESEYGDGNGIVQYNESGNVATCVDVQGTVDSLFAIVTTVLSNSLVDGSLSGLPPVDNGQWDCANVRSTIDTLISILTTALNDGNLLNLPQEDPGQWSTVSESSKCKRDIGYIVEAVTSDLRLGGNESTIRAAEAYYTGNSLDYIENERLETLDAYDYVKNLAISSMRNHNTYMTCQVSSDSSIINVPTTAGLVIGMSVKSVIAIPSGTGSVTNVITNYNDELEEIVNGRVVPKESNISNIIPDNAYIKKIGDGINGLEVNQIQLGSRGSKFDSGDTLQTGSGIGVNVPTGIFFSLDQGVWATSVDPSVDNTVLQDYNYIYAPFECSTVVTALDNYFGIINQIIDNGVGVVDIEYSQINTGSFAKRATLFTLTDNSAGAYPTDPHHLETGTPVRLVPRAREGSNVDKRLIRLPKGFDTNKVYYVIAPGRKTDPYDYSTTTRFDASAGSLQNLMLATSVENAASGIYVYSPETESVHPDVVIDVYQYVLDLDYNLNTYTTQKVSTSGVLFETEEPHVFDVPTVVYNRNDPQKYQSVFFKPIGSGSLPLLSTGGALSENREYYVRYFDKKRFKVFDTLEAAIQNTTPLQFANFTSKFYTLSNKKRSPLRFAPEAGAQQSFDEINLYVEDKTLFNVGEYVRVDSEFFFVTGISGSGSDALFVTRAALGSSPANHNSGASVVKWAYGATATTTTVTETVDATETILDFTSTAGFSVDDYVRLTNTGAGSNSNLEVVKITKIEGNQVIVTRAQLGTFAQTQPGAVVTATRLQLSEIGVSSTLSESYPRLVQSVSGEDYAGGNWYLSTDSSKPNTILERIRRPDYSTKEKTPDTWFERIEDNRAKEDRVYRLRYVIPRYLKGVRDPLRGFVLKMRNDSTRRLLPQRILVEPIGNSPDIPELTIRNDTAALTSRPDKPGYEFLGYTTAEHGPTFISLYDPYNQETNSEIDLTPKYRIKINTDSKITTYVQSARKKIVNGKEYLELVVFDTGIEEQGYKEKIFTTVKIDAPQGGNGVFIGNTANLLESNTSNVITWSGAHSGTARVHAYFAYKNNYYLILKDISIISTLKYSPFETVTFQQGSVSANLIDYPDGGRSDKNNFLYVVEGSNVYTMTPGDTFSAPNGNYVIASVEDVSDIENTFYIFDVDEVRRRIYGQQDGIYYLTCMRANISPFPTGAGVGENFRNFRFSQPVSKLYPEFYKNDPEWYKQLDAEAIDPPSTVSAADNYIHGLVTVNDSKGSVTKESVVDLINDPGTNNYKFTGDNLIQAQSGGASAGSESRKIPICGDSEYPTERKLYVELRRPSIARSGNHTFEYLGFGPGNYSTGFPARQEVVLTDIQDFYAQAKREDGGIVFYTGLNSNGDLYIGNRKINAITGEETFLESAQLVESQDTTDTIGNFVTTFDEPVVFNDIVSFLAPLEKGVISYTAPIFMDVGTVITKTGLDAPSAITIKTNINNSTDDVTLAINPITGLSTGDITLGENRIKSAIFQINSRGLQGYSIRTANYQFTPDQNNTFGSSAINFGTKYPLRTGDILLKGSQVGLTGSLGWIYANSYSEIPTSRYFNIEGFGLGNNYVRINWGNKPSTSIKYTNSEIGITNSLYQIKISGIFQTAQNASLNLKVRGVWTIRTGTFSPTNSYVDIIIADSVDVGTYDITSGYEPNIRIDITNVAWKEVGVLGAETLRTETSAIGDYKLGINTVARSAHGAYIDGFISSETTPRANLDLVGTAFISGKKINSYLTEPTTTKTETGDVNAFLVGGNSASPDSFANLRVDTVNNRLGINTKIGDIVNPSNNLDRSLVIVGDGRITSNFEITGDLQVNGGDLTTTSSVFNFINTNANILNFAGDLQILNFGNNTSNAQNINIGNNSANQSVFIGNSATQSSLRIHRNSLNALVDIATTADIAGNQCDIKIGGAWLTSSSSTLIGTRQTKIAGELEIGTKYAPGTSQSRLFTQTRVVNLFDGDQTNTVNFATNASALSMGSLGGTTTIRNSLSVLATATVQGNLKLNGGLNAGIVKIQRARFSTTAVAHNVGSLANANIDFYKYQSTGRLIDTQGTSLWGSTSFLIAGGQIAGIDNITNNGGANRISGVYNFLQATGGTGSGATFNIIVNTDKTLQVDIISAGSGYSDNDLLTITNEQLGGGAGGGTLTFQVNGINSSGSSYFLPITTPGIFDFRIGDLILIDRGNPSSPNIVGDGSGGQITNLRNEAYSEILRVTGLTNLTNPNDPLGYRIEVVRGQEGTSVRTDHPDGCVIAKLIKQANASYITGIDFDNNGILDTPATGPSSSTADINIGVAEFGGILTTEDYLRLSGSEIVKVIAAVTTDIQSFEINDGGDPATSTFKVESTTGNTFIGGNLGVGTGFNRLTVNGNTGNTAIAGTLTVEDTLTINGSTLTNTQFFKTTNGGSSTVPLRTTFQIDTSNGNIVVNGGNLNFYGTDGTTPRLTFNNSSGDFTTYGSFSALGTGASTFGGDIVSAGDLTVNGGDITVNSGGTSIFEVNSDGSLRIAKINNYITRTGGRTWKYVDGFTVAAEANVNYFVNATQNTLFKLPQNPLIGDMIRVIDIGGNLTYNLSLIVRAPDNVKVQNASDNTARNLASGIPISDFTGYNGGEMVVQTPYAAFALVYAGSTTPDGNSAVPSSIAGWYLVEV